MNENIVDYSDNNDINADAILPVLYARENKVNYYQYLCINSTTKQFQIKYIDKINNPNRCYALTKTPIFNFSNLSGFCGRQMDGGWHNVQRLQKLYYFILKTDIIQYSDIILDRVDKETIDLLESKCAYINDHK